MNNRLLAITSKLMYSVHMDLCILIVFPCIIFAQPIKSIQELLDKSDIVVDAQVLSKESKWTEGKKTIVTMVSLKVLHEIKGKLNKYEFTVEIPGGTIGNERVEVSPSIEFDILERAILFLKKDPLRLFAGRLSKHSIYNEKLNFGTEQIEPDRYFNILKQSIIDKSVLPKFIDEIKKEGEERLSVPHSKVTSKEYAAPNKKKPVEGGIVSPNVVEPQWKKGKSQDTIEQHQGDPMHTKKDKHKVPRNDTCDTMLTPRREKNQ